MRAELRIEAKRDLHIAADIYDDQNAGLGDRFLDYITEMLEELETQAGIHSKRHGYHCKSLRRFSYAIYYLVKGEIVDVAAIINQRAHTKVISNRLRRERDKEL